MLKLAEKYKKEVRPALKKEFGYRNDMAVPRIKKIVVSCGFGKDIIGKTKDEQKKLLAHISNDLALITGQKPAFRKARKSISNFKLRKGNIIGAEVTLRKKRMYDFIERLIYIALPRSRDFRGIPLHSLDQTGNLNLGIREQVIFPEITIEKEKGIFGLNITVVTSAKNTKEGLALLKLIGFPMKHSQ